MRYMIVIAVLEIAAIVVVMALCIAARRADTRTERMLTREEIEARRRPADAQRRRPGEPGDTLAAPPVRRRPAALARGSTRVPHGEQIARQRPEYPFERLAGDRHRAFHALPVALDIAARP